MLHGQTRPTTLVVLTRNFPSPEGDHAFLKNEISHLADSYDRVLVFRYMKDGGTPVSLPPNVEYCGSIWSATSAEGWKQILTPAGMWRAFRALVIEWRSGRMAMLGTRETIQAIAHGTKFARRIIDFVGKETGSVTVYSFWGTRAALALPFLPRRYGLLMRVHGHDLYEEHGATILLRCALHKSVSRVVTISDHGAEHLKQNFPELAAAGKVVTSRLGTPDGGAGPAPKDGGAWTVVSCAYVRDIKRLDLVLETLAKVAEEHPVRWVHFGGGEDELSLRELADATANRVSGLSIDLRGTTPNEEIRAFYADQPVDAFISLSSTEGLPVSIMEAMSYGIPVIATDVGGTRELVGVELGSGILLPPDPTVVEAAEAVHVVCENRANLTPRRVWKERVEVGAAAKRIISILEEVSPPPSRHQ